MGNIKMSKKFIPFTIYQREDNYPFISPKEKDWLNNGQFFDVNVRLVNKSVVEKLYNNHFKDSNFRNLHLYKEALDCILANLVIFSRVNLPLSKPNHLYNKFNYEWFKRIIINNTLKVLVDNCYCLYWKGYCYNSQIKSSKYFLTINIMNQYLDTNRIKPANSILMYKQNPERKKKQIPTNPPLTRMYKTMKADVDFINNLICNSTIKFKYNKDSYYNAGFELQLKHLVNANHLYKNGSEYEINKDSLYIYRSFTRNDYRCGGRFYTPVFQSIPSNIRKSITINNEETIELDYSAHHIRILYNKEGLDFVGEPYIYTKSSLEHTDKRQIHKYIAMIAINAKSRNSAIYAVLKSIKEDSNSGKFTSVIPTIEIINQLYDDFLIHHKPISKYVGADIGIKLQRIDSDIMNDILVELTKLKIVGLPIHDSVIVQKKYTKILKDKMKSNYYKHLNKYPIITK